MHPILFHQAFLRTRPYRSASETKRSAKARHVQRWLGTALANQPSDTANLQRSQIKRLADLLCGVDSRISASSGTPDDRYHGQSRLTLT